MIGPTANIWLNKRGQYALNAGAVIDGVNRLTALQDYFDGVFPVPDAEGKPRYWRDLSAEDRAVFARTSIFAREIAHDDASRLREVCRRHDHSVDGAPMPDAAPQP